MRITTKGIGAHDQDLELGRLTLLVGPNGSGKSKIAEAIRMVALGYVPALGKRPVDLAALMQGEEMSVELGIDGGRTVRRVLQRKGTGFTASAAASWMEQAKADEVDKAIKRLFGDEELDVAECLDIRQLLAATPNQRSGRLEPLLKAGAASADELAGAVARLIVMRLADSSEDRMPKDYRDALPMVPDLQKEVLFDNADMLKTKISEAGLQGALAWTNEEKKSASDGLKKKNAAAEELRKRAVQVPEPDERDIIRLEAEQKTLNQELGAARQRRQDYELRANGIKSLKDQLEASEEVAERTQKQLVDAEAVHGKAVKDLREQCDQVIEKMASLKLGAEEDDAPIKKLEAESRSLAEKSHAIKVPAPLDVAPAARYVAELQGKLKIAQNSQWAEVLAIADRINELALSRGIKTVLKDELQNLRSLAKKGMGVDIDALKEELQQAEESLAKLEVDRLKVDAARKEAIEKSRSLDDQANQKASEAIDARAKYNNRRREALKAFDAKRAELSFERQKLEKAIETHQKALEAARSEAATVTRHMTSLQDRLQGMGELPAAPADPAEIQKKLDASAGELRKLLAARATHTEIHAVLDEIEAAKAAAVVFSAIEWALQRQREIEISNAGGPLMRHMTTFLKGAGRKETPFVRATQGSCAIGWKNGEGKEIQIQALSGGEWVLFAAALTCAVILCRPSVLKILLVEAGETDAKTLTQLMEGIQAAAPIEEAGSFTAVVMSPRKPSERVDHLEAWDVIKTTQEAAATAAA